MYYICHIWLMILADKRKLKGNLISISRKSYPPPLPISPHCNNCCRIWYNDTMHISSFLVISVSITNPSLIWTNTWSYLYMISWDFHQTIHRSIIDYVRRMQTDCSESYSMSHLFLSGIFLYPVKYPISS